MRSSAESRSSDPKLLANNAEPLMERLCAMADSPKIAEKLSFIENVYNHLPANCSVMHRHRARYISRIAVESDLKRFGKIIPNRHGGSCGVRFDTGLNGWPIAGCFSPFEIQLERHMDR